MKAFITLVIAEKIGARTLTLLGWNLVPGVAKISPALNFVRYCEAENA